MVKSLERRCLSLIAFFCSMVAASADESGAKMVTVQLQIMEIIDLEPIIVRCDKRVVANKTVRSNMSTGVADSLVVPNVKSGSVFEVEFPRLGLKSIREIDPEKGIFLEVVLRGKEILWQQTKVYFPKD